MTEKYAKTDNPFVFFDTNILLYSIDENDKNKRAIATKILQDAANNKTGIISTQTLQEFFNWNFEYDNSDSCFCYLFWYYYFGYLFYLHR